MYDVRSYSDANLFDALSNDYCTREQVATAAKAMYLAGYLDHLEAKTILIEYDYIDGDYLDDFAFYYVKCFKNYDRRCNRLHFFDCDVSRDVFNSAILADDKSQEATTLRKGYLGFIVARPLPDAIIGRTLLKTYPDDDGRRHYVCIKDYHAHLFGLEFQIRSLAFQEQDTVLAACATVALWCSFHMTSELFGTPAPRPAAITESANRIIQHTRPIPSHGLNIQQLCNAIKHVGLEPEIIAVTSATPVISLIYAHLRMRLPVILGVRIEGRGLHAVTVAGYSLLDTAHLKQEVAPGEKCLPMVGLRINELYAHDDQIGPFSRIQITPSTAGANTTYPVTFEGSWIEPSTNKPLRLYPVSIIIPVYNKIRVTFLDIQAWLTRLHIILSRLLQPQTSIEWDTHLITTNEAKQDIKTWISVEADIRVELLLDQQPRFIWSSSITINGVLAFQLLADATDMARSFPFFAAVWHRDDLRASFYSVVTAQNLRGILADILTEQFRCFLEKSSSA